jgi:hypothetical protein
MSKEQYVSYDVAKLLKEKGFDWGCCSYWCIFPNGDRVHTDYGHFANHNVSETDRFVSRPTQQMACRWLRKEHNIHIMPTIGCDVDRTPRIFYGAMIASFNDSGDISYHDPLDENGYDEPEDAIEAALDYVLKI